MSFISKEAEASAAWAAEKRKQPRLQSSDYGSDTAAADAAVAPANVREVREAQLCVSVRAPRWVEASATELSKLSQTC